MFLQSFIDLGATAPQEFQKAPRPISIIQHIFVWEEYVEVVLLYIILIEFLSSDLTIDWNLAVALAKEKNLLLSDIASHLAVLHNSYLIRLAPYIKSGSK